MSKIRFRPSLQLTPRAVYLVRAALGREVDLVSDSYLMTKWSQKVIEDALVELINKWGDKS